MDFLKYFTYTYIPSLLKCGHPAIEYFVHKELLGEKVLPVQSLWELPEPQQLLRRQQDDGSWRYPGKTSFGEQDYDQLETFRNLGILAEKYGFHREHPAIVRAADFLFSRQTSEGDFRGIYEWEYAPNYSAAIVELLLHAGYIEDFRISRCLDWLLDFRQDDGGWAWPLRTIGVTNTVTWMKNPGRKPSPVLPDRTKPFSHCMTGMILRGFAAHPSYRKKPEVRQAAELVAGRFFQPDVYVDRKDKSYWLKCCFPFWFTDIASALDTLSYLNFSGEHPAVRKAIQHLSPLQTPDGLFDLTYLRSKDKYTAHWVALAIYRAIKRIKESGPPA